MQPLLNGRHTVAHTGTDNSSRLYSQIRQMSGKIDRDIEALRETRRVWETDPVILRQ